MGIQIARRTLQKSLGILIAFVMSLALCAACAPQEPVLIPTLAMLPSDTPSLTPSITLTASNTPTVIPTPTRQPSPTETLPPPDTATITPTPSYTITLTFTPTDTPIPTATFTPRPTLTPSLTFTPTVLPMILQFTSDLPTVPVGGQTVLRWQTLNSDVTTLELLTTSGTIVSSNKVDPTGNQAVLLTTDLGTSVIYRLTAKNGKLAASKSITINIQCPNPWFFTPAPPGCPAQSASPPAAFKYQAFERGIAFFIPYTNNVYLLANAGNRVNAYPNDWNYTALPALTPPGKFIQPTVEIGNVWLNKRWSDGGRLDELLGWATADQQVYNGLVQQGSATDLYIKGPTGGVYKLALAGAGTWSIVGNAP